MSKNTISIVVLALIKEGDKYLLTLRRDSNPKMNNKWQVPGGGMEYGEGIYETLYREVMEELGVKVEVISLVPYIDTDIFIDRQMVFITYLCKLKNTSEIILNEEATEYRWFSLNELDNIEALHGCKEAIIAAENLCSPSPFLGYNV